jgi:hypothetical protein
MRKEKHGNLGISSYCYKIRPCQSKAGDKLSIGNQVTASLKAICLPQGEEQQEVLSNACLLSVVNFLMSKTKRFSFSSNLSVRTSSAGKSS